ncbi:helix-turn-helix domain-containing protein (plasmid) [Agrobacterium leguminum]|uniref:helix-turn-helix domain-containing protein n=1 Tax=Agrobacterium leguminum TaxID=2792015 RepID=UPI0010C9BB56|nr:helix-turn-helix domain-containing protein [Agrobacterium leguminum]WFS69609.1 helix-turn-helix domain-containing protein [Agrobacterium leguminum]
MFKQIGAVLAGAPAERERTPVRRQSRAAGKCEGVFWRRTNRQEVRQIVLAARRYELACRQPGTRNGPLGGVAIEVLELFANLVNFRTGRLDPSIDFLMLKLRRSRDAIVRALKALRSHGFLDWLRRYVPTGNEGRGPQVQQTSNAYRLSLPARARQFLGRFGMTPPLPDDHAQAEAERTAEMEAHRASLPMDELALFDVGDNPLGQALAKLARSIKQRESARQTESPSGSIIISQT